MSIDRRCSEWESSVCVAVLLTEDWVHGDRLAIWTGEWVGWVMRFIKTQQRISLKIARNSGEWMAFLLKANFTVNSIISSIQCQFVFFWLFGSYRRNNNTPDWNDWHTNTQPLSFTHTLAHITMWASKQKKTLKKLREKLAKTSREEMAKKSCQIFCVCLNQANVYVGALALRILLRIWFANVTFFRCAYSIVFVFIIMIFILNLLIENQ